jgi:DNA-binding SARP family transcriptional activator
MATLKIRLFGKFTVEREEKLLKGLEANKEQELLSFLLVHRNRSHPREGLASLLWGETSTEKSKKYLRQALWHLQSALDAGESAGGQLLVVEHDWVQLNLQSETWLDVAIFEQAFAATQGMAGQSLDSSSSALLKDAVELYHGDLLDGWYQDWCLFERERLQNMYLSMLDRLMSYCEKHAEYEAGEGYGSLILRYDRARERTHQQLMLLHYLSGDRTGALRQYARCVAALHDDLGVKPGRRTRALYERIRDDEFTSVDTIDTEDESEPGGSLPEIVDRLKQLQLILSGVQKRVQRAVKAVEHGLDTLKR